MFLEMAEVKDSSLKTIPVTWKEFKLSQWNLHNKKVGEE